jgi:hypothetical protein
MLNLRKFAKFFSIVLCVGVLAACGGGENTTSKAPVDVPVPKPARTPLPELRILTLGQSISSNCNEHIYGPVPNVFQFNGEGNVEPAKDPMTWAGCNQGSMWMPLGRKLIEANVAAKVVFMSLGEGGTSVVQWQEGGIGFAKLSRAIPVIKAKNISFDFAFWHQGSADIGMSKEEYLARLGSVVAYVNQNVSIARWIIALHSRCSGKYDPAIEAAQREFGNAPAQHRYLGPNTNLLGDEYRIGDGCHLNFMGQERMADLWLESIINALE